jgi:chromosome condensin MukBEF complex kleisin-like MukF subunit
MGNHKVQIMLRDTNKYPMGKTFDFAIDIIDPASKYGGGDEDETAVAKKVFAIVVRILVTA